jgi:hypothetical protein
MIEIKKTPPSPPAKCRAELEPKMKRHVPKNYDIYTYRA